MPGGPARGKSAPRDGQPHRARREDHDRLGHLLHERRHAEGRERDQRRRHIDDRTPAEHDRRARDGAGGGRRHTVDERLDGAVAGEATEVRRRDGDEAGAGQEGGGPREKAAEGTGRTASATSPPTTKSHTPSDSVHAVTTAANAKIAHRRRSPPSVKRTSFVALRPMIAITAAPMP